MAKKDRDLTEASCKGYLGEACPYLATSPSWYAFHIGAYLQRTGRTAPRGVRMGRGYTVHANEMLFQFDSNNLIERVR